MDSNTQPTDLFVAELSIDVSHLGYIRKDVDDLVSEVNEKIDEYGGALMFTTSDPDATQEEYSSLRLDFTEPLSFDRKVFLIQVVHRLLAEEFMILRTS